MILFQFFILQHHRGCSLRHKRIIFKEDNEYNREIPDLKDELLL
jgi:hypothetical protein